MIKFSFITMNNVYLLATQPSVSVTFGTMGIIRLNLFHIFIKPYTAPITSLYIIVTPPNPSANTPDLFKKDSGFRTGKDLIT